MSIFVFPKAEESGGGGGGSGDSLKVFFGGKGSPVVFIPDNSTNSVGFVGNPDDILSDPIAEKLSPSNSVLNSLAAEANTVSLLVADSNTLSGYSDKKSYLDGNAALINASTEARYFSRTTVSSWVNDVAEFETSSKNNLQITSSLTIRALIEYNKSSTFGDIGDPISHFSTGESAATNLLYMIRFEPVGFSSSKFRYFHESGSGSNHIGDFTFSTALVDGTVTLLSIVRHDLGDGTCNIYAYQDGTRLNVTSVSGMTNNTNFVNSSLPTGGSAGRIHLLDNMENISDIYQKFVHIISGVSGTSSSEFDAREAAVATLLGF